MLKAITRKFLSRLMTRHLTGPFHREGEHGWVARLPGLIHLADRDGQERRSCLVLYENGIPVGPAHDDHDAIHYVGGGAYSHSADRLLFSSTDHSDPNTNGRTYTYSLSPWLYRRRAVQRDAHCANPVNYRSLDASIDRIRRDVDQAIRTGRMYRDGLVDEVCSLKGKRVLDIGPGHHFGAALYLAAFGAHPIVSDRFLAPWQPDYHHTFYTLLRDELTAEPGADVSTIDALVRAGGYRDDVITRVEAPMERLTLPPDSVDCIFTSSVIEHLYDQRAAFAETFRITRPGGFGLHFVDFRDHRNMERPLEYLLLSERAFQIVFQRCLCECGSQFRPSETARHAREAGFEVFRRREDLSASPYYLNDFLSRLRGATNSPYRQHDKEDLRVLAESFWLRKAA